MQQAHLSLDCSYRDLMDRYYLVISWVRILAMNGIFASKGACNVAGCHTRYPVESSERKRQHGRFANDRVGARSDVSADA